MTVQARQLLHELAKLVTEAEAAGAVEHGLSYYISPDGCWAAQEGHWVDRNWIRNLPARLQGKENT